VALRLDLTIILLFILILSLLLRITVAQFGYRIDGLLWHARSASTERALDRASGKLAPSSARLCDLRSQRSNGCARIWSSFFASSVTLDRTGTAQNRAVENSKAWQVATMICLPALHPLRTGGNRAPLACGRIFGAVQTRRVRGNGRTRGIKEKHMLLGLWDEEKGVLNIRRSNGQE
jgi:hypothetical protein